MGGLLRRLDEVDRRVTPGSVRALRQVAEHAPWPAAVVLGVLVAGASAALAAAGGLGAAGVAVALIAGGLSNAFAHAGLVVRAERYELLEHPERFVLPPDGDLSQYGLPVRLGRTDTDEPGTSDM